MSRNYQQLVRRRGVLIPRWALIALGLLALVFLGFRIFLPPATTVQRLDSPDGERSARLTRTSYTKDHFVVYGKDGWRWKTLYYGPPITNDFTVDLGERVWWSPDSRYLAMRLQTNWIWGYDFDQNEQMSGKQLFKVLRGVQ